MTKKVLITGGAGFIGSHVSEHFVAAGYEVVVLDDLSRGKRQNLPADVRLHVFDARSAEAHRLVIDERPTVICHHAAQIDVRRSMSEPRRDCAINLDGLLNLMQASVEAGSVRHVVFASSGGAIYGDDAPIPTPEEQPPGPVSHYGAAKAASELYLGVYEAAYGISSTALRYANVYGPRQDPKGEAGVVAIFSDKLLKGEPCTINGDGLQTRDYVFVDDVARANVLAAEKCVAGRFNIGSGVETDVNALYAALARAAHSDAAPRYAPARPGEQRRSCIDAKAAARVLGWRAEVGIDEGLRRTLDYFRGVGAGALSRGP